MPEIVPSKLSKPINWKHVSIAFVVGFLSGAVSFGITVALIKFILR